MSSRSEISEIWIWLFGDRPVKVRTTSGAEYTVHSNGLVSGGTRKTFRRPLIGVAKTPGGTIYRSKAIIVGLRMVINEIENPLQYTSPITEIIPKFPSNLSVRSDKHDLETWCVGDGPIAVRTASGAEYYIDNQGLVSGGFRPIAGRQLIGAVRSINGPLWGEQAIIVGCGMEIQCGDRLIVTSPVVEIIRYTKRSGKRT